MTSKEAEGLFPLTEFYCDLCERQRPGKPRAFGVDFIDRHWACQECYDIYDRKLTAMGRLPRGGPDGGA